MTTSRKALEPQSGGDEGKRGARPIANRRQVTNLPRRAAAPQPNVPLPPYVVRHRAGVEKSLDAARTSVLLPGGRAKTEMKIGSRISCLDLGVSDHRGLRRRSRRPEGSGCIFEGACATGGGISSRVAKILRSSSTTDGVTDKRRGLRRMSGENCRAVRRYSGEVTDEW